jgi:hypothetical protein
MRAAPKIAVAWMLLLAGGGGTAAFAGENLGTERMLADVIQQGTQQQKQQEGAVPLAGKWAILPQIGYSPDKGLNAGIKFTDREAAPARMTIDLEALYALKRQRRAGVTLVAPHFLDDKLILAVEGDTLFDPTKEFFALGNNDVGPDPLSTHEYQLLSLLGTIAARPLPRLTLALTAGFTDVRIRRGRLEDDSRPRWTSFPTSPGSAAGEPIRWHSRSSSTAGRTSPARPAAGTRSSRCST